MKLRKPTEFHRATVDQQARIIVGPEAGAPDGTVRHVQILVPEEPQVFISATLTPEDMGPNRTYRAIPIVPGAQTDFYLQPHQWLVGLCEAGIGHCALIIEYME